jgi:hypothetical protein
MSTVVALLGPIKHWWGNDEKGNPIWGSPDHHYYTRHRDHVSRRLVEEGFLVYRPHEAFKGAWDERAQEINDFAILTADVSLVLNTDNAVLSDGTDDEMDLLDDNGRAYYFCPPGEGNVEQVIEFLKVAYVSK